MAPVGSNIRILRQQMGLSQKALAQAADVDVSTLNRIEKGKSGYSQDFIEKVSKALAVSESVLFAEAGMVEAAVLRMREVPVLNAQQLAEYSGIDGVDAEHVTFLHTDLDRVSRYVFAWTVNDEVNAPALQPGDQIIFQVDRTPKSREFVIAQDTVTGVFYVGQYRPEDYGRSYSVVPLDPFFPAVSHNNNRQIRLRGTMVELRRYFPSA